MRHATRLLLLLLLIMPAVGQSVYAQEGYDLSWWTAGGGGGTSSIGGSLTLGGTAGQPDAGDLAGGAYTLQGGVWDVYEQQGELTIVKIAEDLDGAPLYEGDVVRHVITIENTGETPHTNVVVQDAIPTGTTFVAGSAIPPQTGGPDPLVWTVEELAPGETATFIFRVTVDNGMGGQEIGGNVAWVISDQVDDPIITPPVEPPGDPIVVPVSACTTCRSSSSTILRRRQRPSSPISHLSSRATAAGRRWATSTKTTTRAANPSL